MNVEYISIKDLKEYERNARTHSEKNIATIAESIKQFGFKIPIVCDSDRVLICGHGRVEAAKRMGLESVPCVIADDLTPEQVKAFRLADNRTAELAGWDFAMLAEELEELTALDFDIDMQSFGFTIQGDVDLDDFFDDTGAIKSETKEKKKKEVKCPHCGEVIS